nr:MAG TPA_asm: hypothetical protein [Caudoviricetes sp.]
MTLVRSESRNNKWDETWLNPKSYRMGNQQPMALLCQGSTTSALARS